MTQRNENLGPLSGKVVIELGHSVSAPFAGQILSDLGAHVIKVEKPQGDDARKWGPPFVDGSAATFQALNRNKQSVVVNLRSAEELERLIALIIERADAVIQNLRPGQADSLGLGAQTLLQRKPTLIYCNLGAFGSKGPLAEKPGYDPLMQAYGGIMSVVGEEGHPSVRVGPSIIDLGTGMWAALGVVSALLGRHESGRGAVVDVSLFETAASWMTIPAAQFLSSGELPRKAGSGQVGIAPYRAYQTSDIELVVAAGNNNLFRSLCQVLENPQWADEERFATNPDRVRNAPILYGLIETEMLKRTSAKWMELFDAAGIPCAPVQNVEQMLASPQTSALGILQTVPGSSIPLVGLPISFDGSRRASSAAAPILGAHTREIFASKESRL